eukprot:12868808-Prorocentrum_lima.AAC.1
MYFTSAQSPLQCLVPWPPVLMSPHSSGVSSMVSGSMLFTSSTPATAGRVLKFSPPSHCWQGAE